MQNKEQYNLQDFFDKFKNGELNQEELNTFFYIINKDTNNIGLEHYYTEIWDNSSKRHSDVDSEKIISNIRDNIQRFKEEEKSSTSIPKFMVLRTIFKYAAVFVIAFFISWFGKDIFKQDEQKIKYSEENKINVSYGSKSEIQLPDGSIVNLNSGSNLSYPTAFQNGKRDVYLTGEAFFNVQADEESPFYVHTSDITIKVTGTKFNIKSYPDEKMIHTTLVSGKLQIFDKNNHDKKWAVLSPDETAIYKKPKSESPRIRESILKQKPKEVVNIRIKKEEDINETYAWKENQLVFNNEKFKNLATRMERWYNVKIDIQNQNLNNERFTGKFDTETIEQALDALQLIVPFEYKMNKNNITILKTN